MFDKNPIAKDKPLYAVISFVLVEPDSLRWARKIAWSHFSHTLPVYTTKSSRSTPSNICAESTTPPFNIHIYTFRRTLISEYLLLPISDRLYSKIVVQRHLMKCTRKSAPPKCFVEVRSVRDREPIGLMPRSRSALSNPSFFFGIENLVLI